MVALFRLLLPRFYFTQVTAIIQDESHARNKEAGYVMAVFRVEKNRNYTEMSNHHLKDKGLTLKSKGLLSMI